MEVTRCRRFDLWCGTQTTAAVFLLPLALGPHGGCSIFGIDELVVCISLRHWYALTVNLSI